MTVLVTSIALDGETLEDKYEGDHEVSLHPSGALIVLEPVPDLMGGGEKVNKIKKIYANGSWEMTEVL